jgi:prolipoprotein diacylglyceryltransferase
VGLLAVIDLSFDPSLHIGDLIIRWQTIGMTFALLAGFGVAAVIEAGVIRSRRPKDALRLDDLVYVVLGAVPGAVVGGRIVHGIAFWEAYATDPLRLLDVSVGSLSLTGALLGGTVSAIYIAGLIGAPVRRWSDAAVVPLLLTMGLGKFAQLLGGSGQGAPFDGPWAVAFTGVGPWISPLPDVPAHPSQIYEGIWLLAGIPIVLIWTIARQLTRRNVRNTLIEEHGNGRLFAGMVVWFLLGRLVVGFTWRDDPLVGPLNVEQAIALAILVGIAGGLYVRSRSIVSA